MSEFCFCSMSWEPIDGIWPSLVYTLILRTSGLGLLHVNFHKLIMRSEFHFHSISWEQIDGIRQNFAYAWILTRSRFGLLHINFCKFLTELWSLVDVRISFPLNMLRMNWWNLAKFLHMHWCWQHLGWNCYTSVLWHLLLIVVNRHNILLFL